MSDTPDELDAGPAGLEELRAEVGALRRLLDLAGRAADALASTTVRPAELPTWWWDIATELHRVGGHNETPEPQRTSQLEEQVDAAYDQQVTDPSWWEPGPGASPAGSAPDESLSVERALGRQDAERREAQLPPGETHDQERVVLMGDLTRDQEASYFWARRLTRPDSVQRILDEIERSTTDASHSDELRDLLATTGKIIRHLRGELELQHALWRADDERRADQAIGDAAAPASEEPDSQ